MHGEGAPSDWITRWGAQLPAPGCALDLACGAGRHTRWLLERGYQVTAIDRDPKALDQLPAGATGLQADVERGPWPIPGAEFEVVVVTNYLWRALLPLLLNTVTRGGWLLYETFAQGQERWGRPSRPEFLLAPGELMGLCATWHVRGYEDTTLHEPTRRVQRIAAQRPGR